MTYQVLARKWRPSNFNQLVGQEHVSLSLKHALEHDRLHHAYLFTGTRGVGKTTVARILAKAMNCENRQDANPCGVCPVCEAFAQGRFLDLIEVDAASRTKVEDTRELLENCQYAPHQGRYKIYIIDEVHMLSGHSFNALLKTLEEPPEHVKFLLATTDPHKIPVTVLSRCLQFNLKRLTLPQIEQQMQFILQEEQITFEPAALTLLARGADGSMRDGLSLLDQAIVYGSGAVKEAMVSAMLGVAARQPVAEILRALAHADLPTLLHKTSEAAELNNDFLDLLQQMLATLHRVALLQQLPSFTDPAYDQTLLSELAATLSPEDVQLFYQIGLLSQRDLPLAPDPRCGFEMALLRMLTFKPEPAPTTKGNPSATSPQTAPPTTQATIAPSRTQAPSSPTTAAPAPPSASPTPPPPHQSAANSWPEIIANLGLSGLSLQLANHCVLDVLDDQQCRLLLDPEYHQAGSRVEEKLKQALQHYFGKPIKLTIQKQASSQQTPAEAIKLAEADKQQRAEDNIHNDPGVQQLIDQLDARILPGSIEPLN
jgi:DNA polymerase III subunit gamma/tau